MNDGNSHSILNKLYSNGALKRDGILNYTPAKRSII